MEDKDLIRLENIDQSPKVKELSEHLNDRLKGQKKAINHFLKRYELYLAGFRDINKPIVNALFLGPSGVGKTYFVELLAEYLFGSRSAFTKIDCANFAESHKIASLIGAPPGYVGFYNPNDQSYEGVEPILSQRNIDQYDFKYQLNVVEQDKQKKLTGLKNKLTDLQNKIQKLEEENKIDSDEYKEIKKQYKDCFSQYLKLAKAMEYNPNKNYRSIILFDEIEKAHDSLQNLLLEILDKGRLILSNGQKTRFNNAFIFMTSNTSSEEIAEILEKRVIGFRGKPNLVTDIDKKIYETAVLALKKRFKPEFLGRINSDMIVVFRPLNKEHLKEILELIIRDKHTMFAKQMPILLKIDNSVKNFLIQKALEKSTSGARYLNNVFDKYILGRLAILYNAEKIHKGDTIHIHLENQKIIFYKERKGK